MQLHRTDLQLCFSDVYLWCEQNIREGEAQVDFLVLKVVSSYDY